jgi:hypothetical protein
MDIRGNVVYSVNYKFTEVTALLLKPYLPKEMIQMGKRGG